MSISPAAGQAAADQPAPLVPEPDDYRLDDYRAPVPETIKGGLAVDTPALQALLAGGSVVLIDVLPAPARPPGMAPGALWLPKPRHNIPGSVWLPDVGFGRINDALDRYFRDNLNQATGGDKDRPIVLYCLSDCWMSWNAAKRAIAYGYRRVYWYPDGTEGWSAAGLPLAPSQPVPRGE